MLNSLNGICWNLFRLIGRYYMKPTVKPSISKCGLLHKLVWGQCQIFGNGQTSKYPMSTGLNYQDMQNNSAHILINHFQEQFINLGQLSLQGGNRSEKCNKDEEQNESLIGDW